MKIGFFGPIGSNTEEATKKVFLNDNHQLIAYETIFDAVKALESKQIDKAVVPIENSIEGTVNTTLDMLVYSDVLIEQEIDIPIINNLLAVKGVTLKDIKDIFSHPQALAQCQIFLRTNLPNAKTHYKGSTSLSAQFVSNKKKLSAAAIANKTAAKLYGLDILVENINDYKDNMTRFVVLGNEKNLTSQKDKTSIVFSLPKDKPGGLYKILGIFNDFNINLSKIESRPAKKEIGDYLFFIDFEGHIAMDNIEIAIKKVIKNAHFFKNLGSYPQYKSNLKWR